jgi:hypothetical protein
MERDPVKEAEAAAQKLIREFPLILMGRKSTIIAALELAWYEGAQSERLFHRAIHHPRIRNRRTAAARGRTR